MKKIFTFFMAMILVASFSLMAYGKDTEGTAIPGFDITGGISHKQTEATFDAYRTITGVAGKGTTVKFEVYMVEDDELVLIKEYEAITVSKLGIFSQDVELEIGENIVVITAEQDDTTQEISTCINRKSMDIKKELEKQNIVVPSKTSSHKKAA